MRTSRDFPGLILVEANVLARSTDAALVESYSRGDTEPLFFRPIRAAVAAYEQRLHAPPTHEQVARNLRKLIEQPPSDFDNRIYADRALQQFKAENPADAVRASAKRIEELIGKIERRGARVLLFELPYSEPIEGSRFATITREIIRAAVSRSAPMASRRCEPKRVALGRRRSSGRTVRGDRSAGNGARNDIGTRSQVMGQEPYACLSSPTSHGTLRNPRKRTRPPRTGSPASA